MFSRSNRYIFVCMISRNGMLNWENVDVKNVKRPPGKAGAKTEEKATSSTQQGRGEVFGLPLQRCQYYSLSSHVSLAL